MDRQKVSIFWFRRDLRLEDNIGLSHALQGNLPVLPIFIFDYDITDELPKDDHRITFIYENLKKINDVISKKGSSLLILQGNVEEVWEKLLIDYNIQSVFANRDYEPYAIKRDKKVKSILSSNAISFYTFKDQVIFEKDEILKKDNTPYKMFTPYKNQWLDKFSFQFLKQENKENYTQIRLKFPTLESLGYIYSNLKTRPIQISDLDHYETERNIPSIDVTSNLGPHLRFGTVSIRKIVNQTQSNQSFLNELIWREFFMQILYHYPNVVNQNFKSKYNDIEWRNNGAEFKKWKEGKTGFPIVDAGMRELNQSGYMHNRVRMIVAGFLCKDLLIDWKLGEAYFAKKLFDYELSSNNGNWQWAAGTGCDAAPYFRIFNPTQQIKKFDPNLKYIKKWVPKFGSSDYPRPMVDHKLAREMALITYKQGIRI